MKKKLIASMLAFFLLSPLIALAAPAAPSADVLAPSAILVDEDGQVLFTKNEHQKRPIASVTKVMTLNLVFEAVENGTLKKEDKVLISPHAAGMGGSQVFLDAGQEYAAEDLIKSVIVASGNDAAVALAERVAGSEEAFVAQMNRKAQALKMENTHFVNCTGLPTVDHYSTAYDVALMSRELIRHPDYFRYSGIWTDTITHTKDGRTTGLVNTNRLIRSLTGCDGLKTGFTGEAGFCITTTAKRGEMRLIAVVLGGNTSKERFSDAEKLINVGFACFEKSVCVRAGETVAEIGVKGGLQDTLPVVARENVSLTLPREREESPEVSFELPESVPAPVKAGDKVGTVTVSFGGRTVKTVDLLAGEAREKAGFFDRLRAIVSRH